MQVWIYSLLAGSTFAMLDDSSKRPADKIVSYASTSSQDLNTVGSNLAVELIDLTSSSQINNEAGEASVNFKSVPTTSNSIPEVIPTYNSPTDQHSNRQAERPSVLNINLPKCEKKIIVLQMCPEMRDALNHLKNPVSQTNPILDQVPKSLAVAENANLSSHQPAENNAKIGSAESNKESNLENGKTSFNCDITEQTMIDQGESKGIENKEEKIQSKNEADSTSSKSTRPAKRKKNKLGAAKELDLNPKDKIEAVMDFDDIAEIPNEKEKEDSDFEDDMTPKTKKSLLSGLAVNTYTLRNRSDRSKLPEKVSMKEVINSEKNEAFYRKFLADLICQLFANIQTDRIHLCKIFDKIFVDVDDEINYQHCNTAFEFIHREMVAGFNANTVDPNFYYQNLFSKNFVPEFFNWISDKKAGIEAIVATNLTYISQHFDVGALLATHASNQPRDVFLKILNEFEFTRIQFAHSYDFLRLIYMISFYIAYEFDKSTIKLIFTDLSDNNDYVPKNIFREIFKALNWFTKRSIFDLSTVEEDLNCPFNTEHILQVAKYALIIQNLLETKIKYFSSSTFLKITQRIATQRKNAQSCINDFISFKKSANDHMNSESPWNINAALRSDIENYLKVFRPLKRTY